MPTTGWSSCGVRRARCCRACSTSDGAARSSRAPSATSWCAPAWPAWSSSTSATRRCTSGASTVFRNRGTTPPRRPRCWASPSTSAGSRSRAPITSRWWWTGVRPWRSPSTGRRDSTRRAWPDDATSRCGGGPCWGSRTSTSSTRMAGRARWPQAVPAAPSSGTAGSGCSPTGWSWGAPGPCCPRWARRARARWGTSSGRSSASRTKSSARPCPGCWSSRAAPAPGRRPWRCTGPPTCSTPTASRWSARASSSSAPIPCSCGTSSRSSLRSARPGSACRPCRVWCRRCVYAGSTTPPAPS